MTDTHTTSRPLTSRQECFVLEYAKDFNATQAAIRAGYSARNAGKIGPELLGKTRKIIEARKNEIRQKGIATLEQTLLLTTAMAFGDTRKLFDVFGNCKEIPDLTKRQQLRVAGFEIEELFDGSGESRKKIGYVRKYKLADRAPYVALLLKFHNAFPSSKPGTPQSVPVLSSQYDLTKLSHDELEQFMRMRKKAMVVPNGHG